MSLGKRLVLVAVFTMWATCAAAWTGVVVVERGFMSDLSCPIAEGLSTYGEASWSWFPPGVTCTYRDVTYYGNEFDIVERPPLSRAANGVVLVLWGASLAAVVIRARPTGLRPSEEWNEFDRGRIAR